MGDDGSVYMLLAWVEVAEPDHELAGKFFKNAAEPTSPLSPFSPESAPARDASMAIFRRVLDGSDLTGDALIWRGCCQVGRARRRPGIVGWTAPRFLIGRR